MAATIFGLTTLVFGIASAEAGMVVQKVGISRKTDKKEVRDNVGNYVAVAASYGFKGELSINGYRAGTLLATAVGAALTVANTVAGNGVTGATIILDEVGDDLANEDFEQLSLKATMYNFTSS